MKKDHYLKELTIKATQKRGGSNNNRPDVRKIQSWLSLFESNNPGSGTATAIDGDFGPATQRAVKNFQRIKDVSESGIVTHKLFEMMTEGLRTAFETPLEKDHFRERVIEAAELHVRQGPLELVIGGEANSGPWVRSYMDGHDGTQWFWCMGFVQAILDQAASSMGRNFKTLMPHTYSCDVAGTSGIRKGLLSRYQKVRKEPSLIKPGDVFLIQKSRMDWTHTGIVTGIHGDTIETIEGNTNYAGSRNGIAVLKRIRSFMRSKIDFYSIEPLVG